MLQEWQKELPLFRPFPAQFGKRHAQFDMNRPSKMKIRTKKSIYELFSRYSLFNWSNSAVHHRQSTSTIRARFRRPCYPLILISVRKPTFENLDSHPSIHRHRHSHEIQFNIQPHHQLFVHLIHLQFIILQ